MNSNSNTTKQGGKIYAQSKLPLLFTKAIFPIAKITWETPTNTLLITTKTTQQLR